MYLEKFDTYVRVNAAVKADYQAVVHSRMVSLSASASTLPGVNTKLSYTKGQKAQSHT